MSSSLDRLRQEEQSVDERSPLLVTRQSSSHDTIIDNEPSTNDDDDDDGEQIITQEGKINHDIVLRKLVGYSIIAILFCLAFNLTFLPRTSLSRDLKRIHFDKIVKSDLKRIYLNSFTQEDSHLRKEMSRKLAGINGNQNGEMVEFVMEELVKAGYSRHQILVDRYSVRLDYPIITEVELIDDEGESLYKASRLPEEVTLHVPDSEKQYITGKFAFANYGTFKDFKNMNDAGIKLSGLVVVMRSGEIPDDIKLANAGRAGAIGAVLYNDSTKTEKDIITNPNNELGLFPDDFASSSSTTSFDSRVYVIPSITISAYDVEKILQNVNGQHQLGWSTGELDHFDYSSGVSPFQMNLISIKSSTNTKLKNVILKIPGIYNDEKIYVGTKMHSITDSSASSIGILLEITQKFSKLLKIGWKPLRDINMVFWDDADDNTIHPTVGSKEFAKRHAKEIQSQVVSYLNLENIKGPDFSVESNWLLNSMTSHAAQQISYNNTASLWDHWDLEEISPIKDDSDCSIFQNLLGIPSVNLGFGIGNVNDDLVFDNHLNANFEQYGLMSKFLGLLILNIDERDIMGFKFEGLGTNMRKNFRKLMKEFHPILQSWKDREIDEKLCGSKKLYSNHWYNLPNAYYSTFGELLRLAGEAIFEFQTFSRDADMVLENLQEQITDDYPWFKFYKKLSLLFKIKIHNSRLKKFDQQFLVDDPVLATIYKDLHTTDQFKYLVTGPLNHNDPVVLPGLTEALMNQEFEAVVKWLIIIMDSLDKAMYMI
ncbi:hypothetical protein DASC09_004280 [Saccharomycopsis crataegensis]|uniref:Uncharacterized protein n=1 Tax=Saccharomycopsis crataegensis TaxID=43959 RepID=A0AAV5QFX8_9ASCO|nr:hypothetical protein DASC09_004280 [Saccharomycopsis crataegensis]